MRLKTLQKLRALARASFAPADSGQLDVGAFSLLLLMVFVAPLLYALGGAAISPLLGPGISRLSDPLLEVFAFVIAGITFLSRVRLRSPRRLAIPIAAMTGIAALGALQILPIPQAMLGSVAPVNLQIYHETGQILALFGRKALVPKISIAPSETVGSLLLVLACFALFFSALNILRSRERRRLFALAFFAAAILRILIGTVGDVGPRFGLTSGGVVGYLELALALAFGALWAEILTNRERATAGSADAGERFETRSLPMVGRLLLWAIVAFGVYETGSRVAALAATMTTLVVLAIGVFHRRVHFQRQHAVGALLGLLAVVLFCGTIAGARPLVHYLESDPAGFNTSARVTLWRTAYRAWQDFPIVGSGFGTFPEAVRRVQPRELTGRIEHARSDPLQILVTGGAIGALFVCVLYLSLLLLLVGSFRDQPHREESALLLGGFGALLTLSIHGLVDSAYLASFVPAMLACLLGAAWAATREPRRAPQFS
jgi:hypothetical protein